MRPPINATPLQGRKQHQMLEVPVPALLALCVSCKEAALNERMRKGFTCLHKVDEVLEGRDEMRRLAQRHDLCKGNEKQKRVLVGSKQPCQLVLQVLSRLVTFSVSMQGPTFRIQARVFETAAGTRARPESHGTLL